jgi:hypothetical protein
MYIENYIYTLLLCIHFFHSNFRNYISTQLLCINFFSHFYETTSQLNCYAFIFSVFFTKLYLNSIAMHSFFHSKIYETISKFNCYAFIFFPLIYETTSKLNCFAFIFSLIFTKLYLSSSTECWTCIKRSPLGKRKKMAW